MALNFNIKQNDTSPTIRATLKGSDGESVNLNNATVTFRMRSLSGSGGTVSGSANIFDPSEGVVEYIWLPSDTSVADSYQAEFEVVYSDNRSETFPNTGYIRVEIISDIG